MLRVDAHVHFWDPSAVPLDWLANVPQLNRAFLPDDLLHDRQPPANAWIVVEAGARDPLAEVRWLYERAQQEIRLRALVAGLLLPDVSDCYRLLAAYRDLPLVRGVRASLHGMPFEVVRGDALRAALHNAQALGLTVDLNLDLSQLEDGADLARDLPEAAFALDHGGNPAIRADAFSAWADGLARVAECTNVVCKLSGLITHLPSGADFDVLKPWVHHIMTCFGTERVMIGSDYPVITQAATCAHWFAFLERELEVYSLEAQASLWGGTARRFYHLDLPEFAASERGLL